MNDANGIQRAAISYALRSPVYAEQLTAKASVDCFTEDFARMVFTVMHEIISSGGVVSPHLVDDCVRRKTAGPVYYTVFDLIKETAFLSWDFDEIIASLLEARTRRAIIPQLLEQAQKLGDLSTDIQSVMSSIRELSEMPVGSVKRLTRTPTQILAEMSSDDQHALRLLTGIPLWDNYYFKKGGQRRGQVEFIMAHSGHGKTQFSGYRAAELSRAGNHIAWFQLEDIEESVIDIAKQNLGFDFEEKEGLWHITDQANYIEDIVEECRMLKRLGQLDVVVIDYIQLVDAHGYKPGMEREKMSFISKKLTRMAKDLRCYVMVTSQLRRPEDSKSGWSTFPRVRDMKETSQLEQDAFVITAVFRPNAEPSLVHDNDQVKWWDHSTVLPSYRPKDTIAVKCLKNRRQPLDHKVIELQHTFSGIKLLDNQIKHIL